MHTLLTWLLIAAVPMQEPAGVADTAAGVPQAPAGYDSPRTTMFTFLRAVNAVQQGEPERIDSALAAMDLAGAGVAPGSDEARRAARNVWAALNRLRAVTPDELPGVAELRPDQQQFTYFPRPFDPVDEAILERVAVGDGVIAFARQADGAWRFSAPTVAGIGALSAALSALPQQVEVDESALEVPGWVRPMIPSGLYRGEAFGVRYWQWLGLLIVIFLGVLADFAVRVLVRPLATRAVQRVSEATEDRVLTDAVRAVGLFGAGVMWLLLMRGLALGGRAGDVAQAATGVFAVLAGTLAGWRIADLVGEVLLHRSRVTETKFDDIIVPLLRKTAKLFVVALGVVYGAHSLRINILPLLTGLGIGGLAFAFAAKDTIENLFGSVAVVLDRPFEVGDWVVIGDVEGTVEELGFRSTRIRTFYNSQVTMPNAALVRATVDNFGRRTYRRWRTMIGVQYDTPPEKLLAFTEGIRELIRRHPYTRKDYYQVWCNEFADSSFNILLYVFHEVPDWSTELRERERLFMDIVRLADKLGVQFAFPTRTLHLYKEDHGTPESRYEVPHGTTERQASKAGLLAARGIVAEQPWRKEKPGPVEY